MNLKYGLVGSGKLEFHGATVMIAPGDDLETQGREEINIFLHVVDDDFNVVDLPYHFLNPLSFYNFIISQCTDAFQPDISGNSSRALRIRPIQVFSSSMDAA